MLTSLERLEDRLFQKSRDMGPPWGPILRALRYPAAIVRDWLAGDINVRAMSLAYTTLLSLVPLMAFSFAILKGLGARSDIRFILHEFLRPLGSAANELTEAVLQFVANVRGDVLGAIGLALLTYTVISTIHQVETSFNFVWRVDRPRSFGRRFSEYLSVMVVAPILLAVALELLSSAEHSAFALWIGSIAPVAWTLNILGRLLPYVIVTIVFTGMYAFIPNTRVDIKPAVTGGLTAGVIWALVGQAFTAFIVYSSRMVAIYTGFAIVLTTLIWVYLSWLILLIGAQLAFYAQFPQYLRYGQEPIRLSVIARERVGLSVMYLIGRDYRAGNTHWTADKLAAELDIPGAALAPVLACLEKADLIAATEKEQFLPARDPEGIELAAIIDAVRMQQTGRLEIAGRALAPAARVIDEVEATMRQQLGNRSLKDWISAV
ncbi:MAG: YihY/virulence factor BrkB family protein [Steroidobacteraceae bacterium]